MSVLAIIPARGESKRIPRKNLARIGGVPLIAWSIKAALDSSLIDRVVVSTEDEEIAEVSKRFKAQVPFLRPEALATDNASIEEAVEWTIRELKETNRYHPTIVVCLFPTHPFRTPELIDRAIRLCRDEFDYVHTLIPSSDWNLFWQVSLVNCSNRYRSGRGAGAIQVVDPVMWTDIDYPEDLEEANRLVKDDKIPWRPWRRTNEQKD